MTYQELLYKLKNKENFSFARYGDGEFHCMNGAEGANCDGHEYDLELGRHLRATLETEPNYYIGLQPLTKREYPHYVEPYKDYNWINADIIHEENEKNGLDSLMYALDESENQVLLVGPEHLYKFLFADDAIIIPSKNCWYYYYNLIGLIDLYINRHENIVILYCASMMSEVLIWHFEQYYHNQITQIDIGSAFDPYFGKKTRSYHHRLKWELK